jgi:predicted oxidoreductase (fatty acid repression mutant protein)
MGQGWLIFVRQILFFEDQDAVKSLQAKFPAYAERFGPWATQSIGMLEFVMWTALEAEGLGANLQHYNPLIDADVASTWKIPESWTLNAQMVFGSRNGPAGEKEFSPIEDRFKVFGA